MRSVQQGDQDERKRDDASRQTAITQKTVAAIRRGRNDAQWLQGNAHVLDAFRGEWVVVHDKKVVAHARDGRVAAREGNAQRFPGATLIYVPTDQESEAVRIL